MTTTPKIELNQSCPLSLKRFHDAIQSNLSFRPPIPYIIGRINDAEDGSIYDAFALQSHFSSKGFKIPVNDKSCQKVEFWVIRRAEEGFLPFTSCSVYDEIITQQVAACCSKDENEIIQIQELFSKVALKNLAKGTLEITACFKKVIELNPYCRPALVRLGMLLATNGDDQAKDLIRRAFGIHHKEVGLNSPTILKSKEVITPCNWPRFSEHRRSVSEISNPVTPEKDSATFLEKVPTPRAITPRLSPRSPREMHKRSISDASERRQRFKASHTRTFSKTLQNLDFKNILVMQAIAEVLKTQLATCSQNRILGNQLVQMLCQENSPITPRQIFMAMLQLGGRDISEEDELSKATTEWKRNHRFFDCYRFFKGRVD